MNLTIIGTSHIAQESINQISKAINENPPDIVALELDVPRAKALLTKQKNKINLSSILQIGLKGYIFVKIGQFVQQKLGKVVGVAPGGEMKTALTLAKEKKLQVALIDQPIQITLRNFSKAFTWREKGRFIGDIVTGLFQPRKRIKQLGLENFNLNKVPKKEVIEKMMLHLKVRYPSIYKTLVENRNRYMVKMLVKLQKANPDKKILVIVGAGHVSGMQELLNHKN